MATWWSSAHGSDSVVKTTFHPSYSYEDFIEGYRPDPSKGEFVLTPGIFKSLCARAGEGSDKKFLILIDEINRGDVARILGELITYIEADKRGPGHQVTLQQSGEDFFVPDNIFVLGTMNTADKSISLMDLAIRRRFIFHYYPPDPEVLDNRKEFWDEVEGIRLSKLLIGLNQKLSDAGVDRDRLIGHSYFLVNKEDPTPLEILKTRFRYEIIPLVEEYCYSDRSLMGAVLPDIVDSVGNLNQEILEDDERFTRFLRAVSVQG
jgi:5-methylcytosine-specific restriction protein B